MACDQHGDDINPYDLLHVAAVRKGTRYPPPPEPHSTTDLLAPLAADNARLRQDCEELEQQVVELVARILALEADRDHWRNMVNDLEHNSIYLDSIAFYEGRHAEVTARIAKLEAALRAVLPWLLHEIEYPGDPVEKVANGVRALLSKEA